MAGVHTKSQIVKPATLFFPCPNCPPAPIPTQSRGATLYSPSTAVEPSPTCESRNILQSQSLINYRLQQTLVFLSQCVLSISIHDAACSICQHAAGVTCMKLLSRDAAYADAPTEGSCPLQYQRKQCLLTPLPRPLPGIRRILERETGKPFPRGLPVDTSAIASIRMGTLLSSFTHNASERFSQAPLSPPTRF
jgi:hypothetical protein